MSKTTEVNTALDLVCNLDAIEAEQRDQHLVLAKALFEKVQAVNELPNGYELRLPSDTNTFFQTAKFIENERKCCPFDFTLELKGSDGPLQLKLTGQKGVKQLLQNELGHHIFGNESV